MKCNVLLYVLMFSICFLGCTDTEEPGPSLPDPLLRINDVTLDEGDGTNSIARLSVSILSEYDKPISFQMRTVDLTAQAFYDFIPIESTISVQPGQSTIDIQIEIIGDELKEADEIFELKLFDPMNAEFDRATGTVRITNDDENTPVEIDGYSTSNSQEGWTLAWTDEFNEGIDADKWTYELGDGCPNLCGWGNNELESYTDGPENSFIRDGKLVIKAIQDGSNYTSARMISKNKYQFNFGRIDVRAKMPFGQGIWPAIWLLGSNIDQVGWPACGEIDIMELVGHEPNKAHGTIHYGPAFPNNKSSSGTFTLEEGTFADQFHVFSLIWNNGHMAWMIDDVVYKEIDRTTLGNETYPFNNEFFFILNVAVGGNWPGAPNSTTTFPQEMEVDYIRVFQR